MIVLEHREIFSYCVGSRMCRMSQEKSELRGFSDSLLKRMLIYLSVVVKKTGIPT